MSSFEELERRREAVRREIEIAFEGVTRQGSVSWGEAYGNLLKYRREHLTEPSEEEEDPLHPFHDRDRHWRELVDDPEWRTSNGFSFLDPIGLRYCLPAAILRSLRDLKEDRIASPLTLRTFETELPEHAEDFRDWFLKKWSALDEGQRRCVKNFLAHQLDAAQVTFEAELDELSFFDEDVRAIFCDVRLSPWKEAYRSYWAGLDL